MTEVTALDAANITRIGIGVIIALVVLGLLLSMIITAIVGRIIIVVLVVILGSWVWQQRSSVHDKISKNKCDVGATFFGMHLDVPGDIQKFCKKHS